MNITSDNKDPIKEAMIAMRDENVEKSIIRIYDDSQRILLEACKGGDLDLDNHWELNPIRNYNIALGFRKLDLTAFVHHRRFKKYNSDLGFSEYDAKLPINAYSRGYDDFEEAVNVMKLLVVRVFKAGMSCHVYLDKYKD